MRLSLMIPALGGLTLLALAAVGIAQQAQPRSAGTQGTAPQAQPQNAQQQGSPQNNAQRQNAPRQNARQPAAARQNAPDAQRGSTRRQNTRQVDPRQTNADNVDPAIGTEPGASGGLTDQQLLSQIALLHQHVIQMYVEQLAGAPRPKTTSQTDPNAAVRDNAATNTTNRGAVDQNTQVEQQVDQNAQQETQAGTTTRGGNASLQGQLHGGAGLRTNVQTAQLWQQIGALEQQIIQARLAAGRDPRQSAGTQPNQRGENNQAARTTAQNENPALQPAPAEEELWQQIGNLFRQILANDMSIAMQGAASTGDTNVNGPETRRVLRPDTGAGIRLDFTPNRDRGNIRLQPGQNPSQNVPPETETGTPQPRPGTGVSKKSAGEGAVTPQSGSGTSVLPSN